MLKVKNKRVLNRIADRTRKAGKGRNLIAAAAIMLTSALFTSVFTVGASLIEKQQEATMRQVGGSSHASFKYLTQEEYDIVKKDKMLKEISFRILVGNAVNKELLKLPTEVSYYEDMDAIFCFCYPEEGSMPRKADEIVTSDLVLKALGIPCRIGEKVPLTIDTGKKTFEKTFTLSGYFKGDRIAQSQPAAVSREYAAQIAPTPSDSAMEQDIDAAGYAGRITADFNFSSSFRLTSRMEELTRRCGFPESAAVGINWAYMGDMDMEQILLAAGLLFIILVSGYLIIYNIFYINIYRDIRYYGLLKTVGTTGRQLRCIVRRQAYVLSLYGIPAGLLIGAAVGKLLLPVIMKRFVFSDTADTRVVLNGWIFGGAAVFSFLTVMLSSIRPCRMAAKVSAMEAVRFTEGQEMKPGRQKTKKTRHVGPREMAVQNIKRNRKKVVVVVFSLSLALVLLNSIYSLVRGFDIDQFVSSQIVSDFSVSDATLDNVSVNYESIVTDGVTEEFMAQLQNREGIEEIGNIYMKEVDPQFTDEAFSLIEERIFDNKDTQDTLEYLAGSEGMALIDDFRESRFIDGRVYGIGKPVMERLENTDGEMDWEKFSGGKYVIAVRFRTTDEKGVDFFRPGEKVTVANEKGESREYEVMAVADMPYSCGFQHFGMFNCDFILPEGEYLDLMGAQNPMRTIFDVEPEAEKKTEAWLSDYCENVNPDLICQSKASMVAEFENYVKMYAMVGGLLVLILALIGVLNFINTMVTAILSRRQEFAMMEAVGMTGRQLRKMLCFEGAFYAGLTAIAGTVFGGIVNATLVRMVGEGFFFFKWHFTVFPVLLCVLPLLALAAAVPAVCCRLICRVSVVERLRRAEA